MKKRTMLWVALFALSFATAVHASIRVDHPTGCKTCIIYSVGCPGGMCSKSWCIDFTGLFCE